MKEFNINVDHDAADVRLRPADIAILVFAAERLSHIFPKDLAEALPADYANAITNAAAQRIDRLIQGLEKDCAFARGEELVIPLRAGDRHFFAQVLRGYHSYARDLIWRLDQKSTLSPEEEERRRKLNERFADIFYRLGGDIWDAG